MTDKDLKNIKFLKLEIKRTDRALCQIATESKSGAEYRELLTQTRDKLRKWQIVCYSERAKYKTEKSTFNVCWQSVSG